MCEFEMRIKGKEHDVNDCVKSLSCLFLHHYQTININDDKMAFVYGKCINSINESFIALGKERKSIEDWSKENDLEIEIAGLVPGDRELIEHYHYKNGELVYVLDLPQYISKMSVLDGVEVPLDKYNYHDRKKGYYTIKPEYTEHIEWDQENAKLIVNMRMDNDSEKHYELDKMLILTILYDYKNELRLTESDLEDASSNQLMLYDIADSISKYIQDRKLENEKIEMNNELMRKIISVLKIYGY